MELNDEKVMKLKLNESIFIWIEQNRNINYIL